MRTPVVGEMPLTVAVFAHRVPDRGVQVRRPGRRDHLRCGRAVERDTVLVGHGAVDDVPERRGPARVEGGPARQLGAGVEIQQIAGRPGRDTGEVRCVDDQFQPRRRAGQPPVIECVGQCPQGRGRRRALHDDRDVDVTAAVPVVAEREGTDRDHPGQPGAAHLARAAYELCQVGPNVGGNGMEQLGLGAHPASMEHHPAGNITETGEAAGAGAGRNPSPQGPSRTRRWRRCGSASVDLRTLRLAATAAARPMTAASTRLMRRPCWKPAAPVIRVPKTATASAPPSCR